MRLIDPPLRAADVLLVPMYTAKLVRDPYFDGPGTCLQCEALFVNVGLENGG